MVEYSDEELDRVYAALSSSARRGLIGLLASSSARVTEVADNFDMSLAGVSKHIRVLEDAGLVQRKVQGREHMLRLDPVPLADAASWLSSYQRFWERRLDVLDSSLREARRT